MIDAQPIPSATGLVGVPCTCHLRVSERTDNIEDGTRRVGEFLVANQQLTLQSEAGAAVLLDKRLDPQ